jgi:hypothetical protein
MVELLAPTGTTACAHILSCVLSHLHVIGHAEQCRASQHKNVNGAMLQWLVGSPHCSRVQLVVGGFNSHMVSLCCTRRAVADAKNHRVQIFDRGGNNKRQLGSRCVGCWGRPHYRQQLWGERECRAGLICCSVSVVGTQQESGIGGTTPLGYAPVGSRLGIEGGKCGPCAGPHRASTPPTFEERPPSTRRV